MLNNGVLFTFLYYNKIVKMFDSGDGMNKIYILCEYGISLNIVQKLKKFSINEILYKPYETIGSEKGISDNKGEQILQILSSKEFE